MGGEVGSSRAAKALSKPTVYFRPLIGEGSRLREQSRGRGTGTRSLPALDPAAAEPLPRKPVRPIPLRDQSDPPLQDALRTKVPSIFASIYQIKRVE